MSTIGYLNGIYAARGAAAGFDKACERVRELEQFIESIANSRFFEMQVLDDKSKKLWPISEKRISDFIDLADQHGETADFFYCDTDGKLHPVTVGQQRRSESDEESPLWYATAPLIADGKKVGTVHYSDH